MSEELLAVREGPPPLSLVPRWHLEKATQNCFVIGSLNPPRETRKPRPYEAGVERRWEADRV